MWQLDALKSFLPDSRKNLLTMDADARIILKVTTVSQQKHRKVVAQSRRGVAKFGIAHGPGP